MSYSEPQMSIHQIFEPVLDANITPLHACIVGPKYGLHRFGVEGEEESVGDFSPVSTTYPWPNQEPGSIVDQESAKVYVRNAFLQYLDDTGDFSIPTGMDGENEIEASSLVLQSKNGFSRSSVFGNRDVAIGDKVKVSWDGIEINTHITAVKGEIGSVVGPATADADNQVAVPSATAPEIQSPSFADADLSAAAGGTYDGLADGYVEETYTVTVTSAGAAGVAKAAVISSSGSDDVTEITVVTGSAMDIGTRGLTATITDADTPNSLFVVGDSFKVHAKMQYTLPSVTEGGSYTGPKETKYIIQITEGGVVDTDTPKFKVSTTNGIDIQGETAITGGAIVIGNYGLTVTFVAADQIVKGDAWTIEAIPEEERAMKTLVLGDLLTDGINPASSSDTLNVVLMIEDTVAVDYEYITTTATNVTVDGNAAVDDNYGDTGVDLPIVSGEVFIEYRESLSGAIEFGSVADPTEVEAILGPVVPENELAYGVHKAVINANGVDIYYVNVTTNDASGYADALDRISTEDIVWSIAPMTKDASILELVKAFVLDQSSPINNNWKKGWFCSNAKQTNEFYVETTTGDAILATIGDDAGGSNYVNVESSNANFSGAGVVSGDILKYNPHPVEGEIIWDTAVIEQVSDNKHLILKASAIDMPLESNIEIWRTSSLTDFAEIIAAGSAAYGDRRINNIWPDVIPNEMGIEVPGYFLCAALAGYRSGVAPHQPLTRAQISGFGTPSRSTMFSRAQLNIIAGGGTWIVTSDITGAIYTRHQLTTDMTSEETREDSITSNLDSISRIYREGFDDVIGRGNLTPDMLELLEGRVFTSFKYIHNLPYPRIIGPQMLAYELLELAIDPILKSKVRIRIRPELPMPLNDLDIFFYIG